MTAHSNSQSRIAIVGTGLAGLVTAYLLHNDPKRRYRVTLFERQDRVSLGAASVLLQDKAGQELVDVPMRSFAPGYYCNLKSMLDFLQIPYRVERFLFAFSRGVGYTEQPPVPYYIHASNRHRIIPPRPFRMTFIQHILRIAFLALCYLWLSICCFVVTPLEDETLRRYLQRIRIPRSFTTHYLLPLISSVATSSHEALLQTPANDFVKYKRKLYKAEHYTVADGIWAVERKLLRGVDIKLSCEIEEVKPVQNGVRLRWRETGTDDHECHHTDVFDNIVLAVAPNVIARIFTPLRDIMSQIPTVDVQTFIIQPRNQFPRLSVADANQNVHHRVRQDTSITRFISLKTHSDPELSTITYQSLRSGAFIVTNVNEKFDQASVLTKARFARVLRTVESRNLVNEIFREDDCPPHRSKTMWKNGDSGVWIAGAWCWDGMVLLEGCVVSAMRIAEAFDVETPWAPVNKSETMKGHT